MNSLPQVYKVRPRKDRRGFDLFSDALPFGRLWYTNAVIRVYDEAGNVIETHERKGDFKEP